MTFPRTGAGHTVVGSLHAVDGKAVVRMEDRFSTDPDDLWSALTDPQRLARWIAQVEGDLRLGGQFRARFTSSWEGPGRVDVCDPPKRLLVTMSPGQDDQTVIEAEIFPDADHTRLVLEERGLPLGEAAAHGAGWQAHVEDLAAHLAGGPTADWRTRWTELTPAYRDMQRRLDAEHAEHAELSELLTAQRESVLAIVEGLDDAALRQAVVPSGWTPLGMIEPAMRTGPSPPNARQTPCWRSTATSAHGPMRCSPPSRSMPGRAEGSPLT